MKVAIVGHGPSLLDEPPKGGLIDQCDCVIRLKRSADLLRRPVLFGSRTTIYAGSLTIFPAMTDYPAKEFWILYDSRHVSIREILIQEMMYEFYERAGKEVLVREDRDLCNYWDREFRDLQTNDLHTPEGSEDFYPHLSQGMKALVLALEWLGPEEVHLFGFDNVAAGKLTWSLTRGPDYKNYPKHNWRAENVFIRILAKRFEDSSLFLNGEKVGF